MEQDGRDGYVVMDIVTKNIECNPLQVLGFDSGAAIHIDRV